MHSKLLSVGAALTVALGLAGSAQAGAFAVSEYDPQMSGRAFTASAQTDSPSAVIFNPANMAAQKGLHLSVGAVALMPGFSYTPDGGTKTSTKFGVVPAPAISITDNLGTTPMGDLAVGFGVYAPYGSAFTWPSDWVGRGHGLSVDLKVVELTPAIALKPCKHFALGAGFRFLTSSVYLKQAVLFGSESEGTMEMSGSGNAVAASLGASVWPIDGLSVGFSWRSKATLKLSGQSNYDFPAPFDTMAVDRPGSATIPLAQEFRGGVAYDVIPKTLNVGLEVVYQLWSPYKELKLVFTNPDGTTDSVGTRQDSLNTLDFGIGGEYRVTPDIAVRAGYYRSAHTTPEQFVNPSPPDSNQNIITLGGSYFFGTYGVHFHVLGDYFAKRTTKTNQLPGVWQGGLALGAMAYNVGVSFSAALDTPPVFGSATPATRDNPAAAAAPQSVKE